MVKISVIVCVVDGDEHLRQCLRSVRDQSMPTTDYEVLIVDGRPSAGGPQGASEELGDDRPGRHLLRPGTSDERGRLRNRGLSEAAGEYVLFCDADDWLGTETLERLHRVAVENRSDIVLARIIGLDRPVPRTLFRKNRRSATPANAPLLESLSPHGLIRRGLLDQHGLRFSDPASPVADHLFTVRCYFAATKISIATDYNYFFEGGRRLGPAQWVRQFNRLREVLAVVEANSGAGAIRDRMTSSLLRTEVVQPLTARDWWRLSHADAAAMFAAAHRLAQRYLHPETLAALSRRESLVAEALVVGDFAALKAMAAHDADSPTPIHLTPNRNRDLRGILRFRLAAGTSRLRRRIRGQDRPNDPFARDGECPGSRLLDR